MLRTSSGFFQKKVLIFFFFSGRYHSDGKFRCEGRMTTKVGVFPHRKMFPSVGERCPLQLGQVTYALCVVGLGE